MYSTAIFDRVARSGLEILLILPLVVSGLLGVAISCTVNCSVCSYIFTCSPRPTPPPPPPSKLPSTSTITISSLNETYIALTLPASDVPPLPPPSPLPHRLSRPAPRHHPAYTATTTVLRRFFVALSAGGQVDANATDTFSRQTWEGALAEQAKRAIAVIILEAAAKGVGTTRG